MSITVSDVPAPAAASTHNGAPSARASGNRPFKPRPGGGGGGGGGSGKGGGKKGPPPQEVIKTWAFDSVGTRKYALQIRKASNGNPCIKIVEGVPQADGTFRKFDLTVWSEDWPRLFQTLDALRAFIAENNIRTPEGHKYDPNKKKPWRKKP